MPGIDRTDSTESAYENDSEAALKSESPPIPGAVIVPVDMIDRDPGQPRHDWRHDSGYERLDDLTRSVAEFGILQPLVVRQVHDRYMVIAGGRRLVAARRAGLTHVPVIVRDDEGARVRVLQLVENVQRQQLTPLDEARAYQELMEIEGLTTGGVAARLHVSVQTVRDKLRLLRDQVLADAVERRQITATAAREINKLPEDVAEQLRHRIQRGERLHVSHVHEIRAQLHAAGIINPRRNPRPSDRLTDISDQHAATADAGIASPAPPARRDQALLAQEAERIMAERGMAAPLFYDQSLLPAPISPAKSRNQEKAVRKPDEIAGWPQAAARSQPLRAETPVSDDVGAEDTSESNDHGVAGPGMEGGPSLRYLIQRLPRDEVEALLEYGVVRGWSAASLLHLVRLEYRR